MLENKMKLSLTNTSWVSLSLNNDFEPHLEWELEDQTSQAERLQCVKRYSRYWKDWKLEYESHTKEVYKREDKLHNVHYLIVKFE